MRRAARSTFHCSSSSCCTGRSTKLPGGGYTGVRPSFLPPRTVATRYHRALRLRYPRWRSSFLNNLPSYRSPLQHETPGGNTKAQVQDTISSEEEVYESEQIGRFVARASRGTLDQHGQHGRGYGGQREPPSGGPQPEARPGDDVQRGRGAYYQWEFSGSVTVGKTSAPGVQRGQWCGSLKFNKPLHFP